MLLTYKKMEVTNPQKFEGFKTQLNHLPLEVPIYQREYSWELEQVSDLFHDINNSTEESPLFLGSFLYYINSDSKIVEIIDGQQRLTTIFLMLYCIRLRVDEWYNNLPEKDQISTNRWRDTINDIDNIIYKKKRNTWDVAKSNELYLTTSIRDRELFKSILQGDELKKDNRRKSHKLLQSAFTFLNDKTTQVAAAESMPQLIQFFNKINNCLYISLTANQKEDQRMLFKTLNSRGKELSESDMIKNEVCIKVRSIENSKEEIIKAVTIWDRMRVKIENGGSNVDLFLFHYINHLEDSIEIRKALHSKNNLPDTLDESRISPFISEKLIFAAYEYKILNSPDIFKLLEDLEKKANYYYEFYKPDKKKKYGIFLEGLRAMNLTKCYPLLLRGRQILNESNFEKLCKAIECISLRYSILKREPKELEHFYYQELLIILKSDNDIDSILKKIHEHHAMTDDSNFENLFCSASPKYGRMIIQRIINSQGKEAIDFSLEQLEHIMPQTPSGEWLIMYNSNKDKYEEYLNRLGNLTYMTKPKNAGAGNSDFSIKKEYYSKSGIDITKNLIEYDKWGFEEIEKRQKYLYQKAKDIWKI